MPGHETKMVSPETLSHKSLNVKGIKYWGIFFLNWLTEGASLVYNHTFLTLNFCASNKRLPCLSPVLPLTECFLEGHGEGRWAWDIAKTRHTWGWETDNVCGVCSFLYEAGGESQLRVRKIGLGRGGEDSMAGEESRRERRPQTSEGRSHSTERLPRRDMAVCSDAASLAHYGYASPAAPQVQEQRRQGDPRTGVAGMERQEPGRGGQRCQVISHLRQGGG